MADPRLVPLRGFVGKGHCSRSLLPVKHHYQPGQDSSLAVPVSDVSWHVPQEPDFEGFSGSGAGFSPFITNRRIFVLGQAIGHFV